MRTLYVCHPQPNSRKTSLSLVPTGRLIRSTALSDAIGATPISTHRSLTQAIFSSPATAGAFEAVQSLAIGETWVPSPRIVNSFHAAITLRNIQRGPNPAGNVDANTVGISVYQDATDYFPFGATSKWSFYGGGAPAVFVENTFGFGDDVNWVKGKHNIGFGGEFTRSEFNENNIYQSNGAFTFSGLFSKTGPAAPSHGGTGEDANLDFLTGALGGFSQSGPTTGCLAGAHPDPVCDGHLSRQ